MTVAVEVRALSKSFGAVRAVDALSLTVSPGETLMLLGPNGSGKTTTIRSIAGLLKPTSGAVLVMGEDARRTPKRALANLAFVPQHATFPAGLTAREIVEFHASLRRVAHGRSGDALREAGIAQEVESRPVGTFSGGMRQRLSLAVAIVSDAPVMLLDEPTANLDPEAAISFRQVAKKWRDRGKALLVSTHVLSDVEEIADRVVIMVGGRSVASITVSELRLKLQRFARLRVDVGAPTDAHIAAALASGATNAKMNSHAIIVTAPIERRLAILDRLAAVGAVRHFETEEPSLEDVYIEYVKGGSDGIP